MYRCKESFYIERGGETFYFDIGTLWDAKENEYGSITIINNGNQIVISPSMFKRVFEKE